MKRIISVLSITICLCLTIVFCATTDALAKAKPKINKKSITINVGSKSKLKVKNTKKKIKWKSKNTKIATVSAKGVITGKQVGSTIITAKVGKKKLTCKVTVKAVNKVNVGDWLYTEHTATVTINGYRGTSSNITVPTSINGKKVIALSDHAFYGSKTIKSIIIPEGIEWFGYYTFTKCEKLEVIQAPASLKYLHMGMAPLFDGCNKLKQIRVKKGSTFEYYAKEMFDDLYSDKVIYY